MLSLVVCALVILPIALPVLLLGFLSKLLLARFQSSTTPPADLPSSVPPALPTTTTSTSDVSLSVAP